MGDQPAQESWFSGLWRGPASDSHVSEKAVIGILAFEISSLMSKVVNLWHVLGDGQMVRLKDELSRSVGMKKLVSEDIGFLMSLVYSEVIDTLEFVAGSVARIGKRCIEPGYHHLDCVFGAATQSGERSYGWEYRPKKMERKVRKMEKFVAATGQLHHELDVLCELEQTLSRMQRSANSYRVEMLDFHQKVMWQRQEVKNLREMSPWNRSYDYVILLLTRCLLTVAERIKQVFRPPVEDLNKNSTNKHLSRSISHSFSSGGGGSGSSISCHRPYPVDATVQQQPGVRNQGRSSRMAKARLLPTISPFKGCMMMGGSDSPVVRKGCMSMDDATMPTNGASNSKKLSKMKSVNLGSGAAMRGKLSPARVCRLMKAPDSTLGDAALALHYANVVILVERLAVSPPCVSMDVVNDLYNMLPASLRARLRRRLKPFTKTLDSCLYDAALAVEWSLALESILEWLAPLAHNMIRWQAERNFEKHRVVTASNVFLVQTIYFAGLENTEAAIAELLVGLNYIWRFGRDLDKKTMV